MNKLSRWENICTPQKTKLKCKLKVKTINESLYHDLAIEGRWKDLMGKKKKSHGGLGRKAKIVNFFRETAVEIPIVLFLDKRIFDIHYKK